MCLIPLIIIFNTSTFKDVDKITVRQQPLKTFSKHILIPNTESYVFRSFVKRDYVLENNPYNVIAHAESKRKASG